MQKKVLFIALIGAMTLGTVGACKGSRVHNISCTTRGSKVLKWGEKVRVRCPKKCAKRYASVYGTDIYTTDSSVCRAAIHAGVIRSKRGGRLTVKARPGQSKYEGTEAHGIKTSSWSTYPNSFKVSK